jgi:hypothetical protein
MSDPGIHITYHGLSKKIRIVNVIETIFLRRKAIVLEELEIGEAQLLAIELSKAMKMHKIDASASPMLAARGDN